MRFLAVINPAAGGGRCGKRFPVALKRLKDAGLDLEVVQTSGPGTAVEIVREAWAGGHRRFLAVGGDGTAYEMVNGMFPAALDAGQERAQLGFLPLGTGNSFLRDFIGPRERTDTDACAARLERRPRRVDVVRLRHVDGELYFINLFAVGFAADVNARAARLKGWGELGYVGSAVAETLGLKSRAYPMRMDGGPWVRDPAVFIAICNSRFTGGKMMMAPQADPTDGKVDVIRVGDLGRTGLLRAFPRLFEGTHVDLKAVSAAQVQRVEFQLEGPTRVMLDGEALHVQPLAVEVLPGALEVLC